MSDLFGLDAELKAKQDAKFDPELEAAVVGWIEAVTETQREPLTTAEWLKDGQVLCSLANKIRPGTIKKVNTMMVPFKKMENITKFTDAVRMLGVNESSMFATVDLYEEKNMGSVIQCLSTFAGVVQTTVPEFAGPHLGIPIHAVVKDQAREKKMATQTGGLSGTLEKASARMAAMDPTFGARQAGGTAAPDGEGMGMSSATAGLDADLEKKKMEKYDHHLEAQLTSWIEAVTGQQRGEVTFGEWLHDGSVLGALANTIKPGSVKVSPGATAFKQMENISEFIRFARSLEMAESLLFSTPDLFEEKDLGTVLTGLNAFAGVVQVKVPEFDGPKFGKAIHAEIDDVSRGLGLVTDQNEAMERHMVVERPKDNMNIMRDDKATR